LHVGDAEIGLQQRDERGLIRVREADGDRRQRREEDAAGAVGQGRRS
jgi:hypothetical protein